MSDPVDPIASTRSVRRPGRRATDPRVEGGNAPGEALPMTVTPPQKINFEPQNDRRRSSFAAFAAHLLGQSGQKRGLRAGPEAIDNAKASYLGVEWSGPSDRRTRKGVSQKTEI